MACKWTYKGKLYSEGEFIALMAQTSDYDYLFPESKSWGERLTDLGNQMDKGVDDMFKDVSFTTVPFVPQAVKQALKAGARIIKAGGKLFTAVERAVREMSKITGEKYNEMQKDALRKIMTPSLTRFQEVFNRNVSQMIPGTTPYRNVRCFV